MPPQVGLQRTHGMSASFNSDSSCCAVFSSAGYEIFTCSPFASCHVCADCGISVVEMLHCSSLVALVGIGEQSEDSPRRRLRLWNTRTNTSICELNFSAPVLGVRMSRARLLACLETRVHVFELSSMKLLHTLETARPASPPSQPQHRRIRCHDIAQAPNRLGLADMCVAVGRCHAVLPAAAPGQILFFDAPQLHALPTLGTRF